MMCEGDKINSPQTLFCFFKDSLSNLINTNNNNNSIQLKKLMLVGSTYFICSNTD